MTTYYPIAAQAIGTTAEAITRANHSVALWNYSSPLNPWVTKGWRNNIGFSSDGAEVSNAVRLFGTGGVPQTRSAILAAANAASEQTTPVRLLVVTSGTQADINDGQFSEALNNPDLANVSLTVLHVGDEATDPLVRKYADEFIKVENLDALAAEMARAAGL